MRVIEGNIDGLVGPTHHYAGMALGNIASHTHAGGVSNPRAAALQGLEKMRRVASYGIPQLVMPPHPRPYAPLLRSLGFTGEVPAMLAEAVRVAPHLLSYLCSSSGMWAANAATITPSRCADDERVHLTPANLLSTPHRAIEGVFSAHFLRRAFANAAHFTVHDPLLSTPLMADEGAANHMRLQTPDGDVHVFVYGREGAYTEPGVRYPARQTRLACEAIARAHRLNAARCVFFKQSAAAINAGVFHNDVIATSHENLIACA